MAAQKKPRPKGGTAGARPRAGARPPTGTPGSSANPPTGGKPAATASQPDAPQIKIGALLLLAAVIGVAASLAAVLFVVVEHNLQHLIWTELPELMGKDDAPWWMVYVMLLLGAVLVHLARRLPGDGGHEPLQGLSLDIGPNKILSVVLATLASLAFGAVVGPEAPLMAIGTAVAVTIAMRRDPTHREILMLAGAMAAVGMIFGNPMVTSLLLLEAAALKGTTGGKAALVQLLPALLALGCGYLVQVGVGDWGGFGTSVLAVPGLAAYPTVQWVDLAMTIPVALVSGMVIMIAVTGGRRMMRMRPTPNSLPVLLVAGFIIASAAVGVTVITGASVSTVLFSGQSAIPEVLTITSYGTLGLILVGKAVAWAASIGAGFRGGLIFPGVYLGVVVGVTGALMVSGTNQSAMVAAGIAAGAGAVLRLPFTSTLLAVLLCGAAGPSITSSAIIAAIVGVLMRAAVDARFSPEATDEGAVDLAELESDRAMRARR